MIRHLVFASLSVFLLVSPALISPALSASLKDTQAEVKKIKVTKSANKKAKTRQATRRTNNKIRREVKANVEVAPIEVSQIKPPVLKNPAIAEKYQPQIVEFSGYRPGMIVIDPKNYFLYFVESAKKARRYGIAVGQAGLQFKGSATISAKREWPRWIPTPEMIARNPAHYGRYANGMDGGPGNPLGARALYLSQGNKDTYIRIHGTVQPWTIGTPASNGCFRMTNDHVIELYEKVQLGAEVVVL